MSITALSLFKEARKLTGDDDVLAQAYLDAAESAVEARIGAPLGSGDGQQEITPAITAAILLWASHLHANREAVVTGTIATTLPLGVAELLAPYRRWNAEPV